jgi:hypothetical protein
MESDDISKLKDLQSENQALKQIVADKALVIEASKNLLRNNGVRNLAPVFRTTSLCGYYYYSIPGARVRTVFSPKTSLLGSQSRAFQILI